MRIFQLSDLHLDETFKIDEYNEMLEKMADIIACESKNEDNVHIVCCGDIVNRGNPKEYNSSAISVFDFLKNKLDNKSVDFICVPGNHDLCNNEFTDFQEFIKRYNHKINFISDNVSLYETTYINYLLINTSFHKEISYGNVDLVQLKKHLHGISKPIIVVMHHTLMSRYAKDRSSISNAYEFLKQLEDKNVIGIVHGHTHGYSDILVGTKCRLIGVGSLFEYFKNCNNQFNVIEIGPGTIERIENYRYHFDLKDFKQDLLYKNSRNNFFEGNTVSDVYMQIKNSVKYYGGINNLSMIIKSDLSTYKKDMVQHFMQDINSAKLWLEESVPSALYYNHGKYMVSDGEKGIDYVVDELNRNSTSNRAIIPLIHFGDVLKHRFDYLPGLNSVQFGFVNDEKTELCCSVYLRSLEVSKFLKINLSEIFTLVSHISEEIRSIQKINIYLYAFKAQYKEHFSCFKKAYIDTIGLGELAHIIYKDSHKLFDLLKNKFDMNETIVNTSGLELLYDIMHDSQIYSVECINGLADVINKLKELESEYRKNSNYHTIEPLENNIRLQQQEYLSLIAQEVSH